MNDRPALSWVSLGHLSYDEALEIQQTQNHRLLSMEDDTQSVFTVEHPPTITIGRNGTTDHIVASEQRLQEMGFVVRHVDRGGDVTYHGPGQLVVYPVLHLAPWENDVSLYVRNLEQVVISALAEVNIVASRLDGYPGVWVGNRKICAVGARIRKRLSGEFVTSHGIALNVTTNLSHFDAIVPCGITDKGVTSVAKEIEKPVDLAEWETRVKNAFQSVFVSTVHFK
jgi:lipoyl(octanoyl) transferase